MHDHLNVNNAVTMISDLHVFQVQARWNSDAQLYWKGWSASIMACPKQNLLIFSYCIMLYPILVPQESNSMTQSASQKVKSCTVQLEISHTLWTMKFHCRTHNLPLVPILSQSAHTLCKVHCNIIFTHIARFSKWSFPFSFSAKLYAFLMSTIYATWPSIAFTLIWSH